MRYNKTFIVRLMTRSLFQLIKYFSLERKKKQNLVFVRVVEKKNKKKSSSKNLKFNNKIIKNSRKNFLTI